MKKLLMQFLKKEFLIPMENFEIMLLGLLLFKKKRKRSSNFRKKSKKKIIRASDQSNHEANIYIRLKSYWSSYLYSALINRWRPNGK